jgi:3-oxochol-4-en-24-oyl-CoA dehydrogenase
MEAPTLGDGQGGLSLPGSALIGPLDANPDRVAGGAARVGRYATRW